MYAWNEVHKTWTPKSLALVYVLVHWTINRNIFVHNACGTPSTTVTHTKQWARCPDTAANQVIFSNIIGVSQIITWVAPVGESVEQISILDNVLVHDECTMHIAQFPLARWLPTRARFCGKHLHTVNGQGNLETQEVWSLKIVPWQ